MAGLGRSHAVGSREQNQNGRWVSQPSTIGYQLHDLGSAAGGAAAHSLAARGGCSRVFRQTVGVTLVKALKARQKSLVEV